MSKIRLAGRLAVAAAVVVAATTGVGVPAQAATSSTTAWAGAATDSGTVTYFNTANLALTAPVDNARRLQLSTSGFAHSHSGTVSLSVELQPSGTVVWSTATSDPSVSIPMAIDVTFAPVTQVTGIKISSSPPQGYTFHDFSPSDTVTVIGSTQCNDGVDNDGDGRTDYSSDPGCTDTADNTESPDPACGDGVDNDGDGRTDFPTDPGCTDLRDTSENSETQCSDRVDNDGDGKTDFPNDPGCSSTADNTESPNPACSDGIDNEGDGRTDFPADPGCTDVRDTTENSEPQCMDNLDNDGDGRRDHPNDYGCSSATDNSESPNPQCSDGMDNDADGRTDYGSDTGCTDYRDASEGATCSTTSGVEHCLGISPGTEFQRVRVYGQDVVDGTFHSVAGYLEVKQFRLPTGDTVNLPCAVTMVDGKRVDPCGDAGGRFISRIATLVEDSVAEPVVQQGAELTSAALCNAELVATVNSIGVASTPVYTLC